MHCGYVTNDDCMCNKWHTRKSINCMHALTIFNRVPVATYTHNCPLNIVNA